MAAATIYDVAKLAGVSHQTVTRHLHGFKGIRPQTRKRVEDAIVALDYRPNFAAKYLRSGKSNRIVVFSDRIDQNGPSRILSGATAMARECGYYLDVVVADGADPESVSDTLKQITEQPIAGILATVKTEVVLEELKSHSSQIPLVIETQPDPGEQGPPYDEIAGCVAANHLLDLGHREFGYLAGPKVYLASQSRLRGFTKQITERGGILRWTRHGDWTPESGYATWNDLAQNERSTTAIACANDSMAIGIISSAFADGVKVPYHLSVIGTDDLPEARFMLPSISTVAMDFEGEGRAIMATLIAKIEDAPLVEDLSPKAPYVIPRSSTSSIPS